MAKLLCRKPIRRARASLLHAGGAMVFFFAAQPGATQNLPLPDAPSAILGLDVSLIAQNTGPPQLPPPKPIPPCDRINQVNVFLKPANRPVVGEKRGQPCIQQNPVQPIVSAKSLPPLTWQQKGQLAGRDVIDPFNLFTIAAYSGIVVGINSHTAYGPGFKGAGMLTGYSLLEDAQGEFFGTFAIPSLVHEDPRYYRVPGRPIGKRILHALSHTVITRHDDGSAMPNYATLLTYPISAELSNLYVPGVADSAPSTGKRIVLGLATDPAGSLIAEFLPDIAKRIHIRIIFVQQILEQVVDGAPNVN